jgi:predicted metal-dependent HD superfamily phosphohydrolase
LLRKIEEVERLVAGWSEALGNSAAGYRNHIYRVVNLCALQRELRGEALRQVVIAACFHDVAIWLDETFDYLAPSQRRAAAYLEEQGLASWSPLVGEMIVQHHRMRRYRGAELVEIFRRADWIDLTLGSLKFGLPASAIREIREAFPNAGFHRFLLHRSGRELLRRPWNPLPMMRW